MDIGKKINHNQTSPKKHKLWPLVLIAMMLIVAVWALWFYPKTISSTDNDSAFSSFKEKINNAVGIFKSRPAPDPTSRGLEPDIEDLRARVFGDKISK